MAKKNDLAALAALGALGYMFTRNGDKVDLNQPTSSGDSNPTRGAGYNSTETRPDVRTDFGGAGDEMSNVRRDVSSGDEMSKYAAINKSRANSTSTQTPIVIPDNLQNLPTDENARSLKLRNPPVVITKELQNLPENQSAKSLKERNPPIVIPDSMKNLANVPTNFGSLVNPYPTDNKAAAKANARQAAIEATNRHNEDQKAIMAERRRNQKGQQDLGYGQTLKRGGAVKKMASGGMTSSASRRGDGIATKGKTRGKIC